MIQQDRETGAWIYIVTDRDTGAIIARCSREEVAQLGLKADYAAGAFASNGFGAHSPAGFSLMSALLAEIVLTAIFIFVICRVTAPKGAGNMAPVAIGLTLTMCHIMSIPIDNTSLNPARSTATVLFASEVWPLAQLWLFWVAPIVGGFVGGLIHKSLGEQA